VSGDEGLELKVTVIEAEVGQEEAEDCKGKVRWREIQSSRGRQENSLRTVCYNSEVLYTNTGWSVCSPLGLALY